MSNIACVVKQWRWWPAFTWLLSFGVQADIAINPPAYTEMSFEFNDAAATPQGWQPLSGTWSLGNGTYNSTSPAPAALTIERRTVTSKDALDIDMAPAGGMAVRFRAYDRDVGRGLR